MPLPRHHPRPDARPDARLHPRPHLRLLPIVLAGDLLLLAPAADTLSDPQGVQAFDGMLMVADTGNSRALIYRPWPRPTGVNARACG